MNDPTIITMLAGGLACALIFGWLTQHLGLSTLVGYMLAGIAVGPYTPGFVANREVASQLAEVGVILLMFGVGMHFHPQELLRVKKIAIPGAIAQSAVATVAGWGAARAFGWNNGAGLVFGMALAVASTVVLVRMLLEQDRLGGRDGHVAVGWLIVQDLITVVALVVLPVLATGATSASSLASPLLLAFGKAAVFAALVWVVGTRLVSRVMERMARTRSEELFTVAVFVVALGVAIIASEVFHVSAALGAFFAGLVVGQSRFGPQASVYMTPLRDVFSALFFVSVGMLFNPNFVLAEPFKVLTALSIILLLNPLVALGIVTLLRDSHKTAATIAVGLAQIGEFSFILGALGLQLGVLPPEGLDALIAAAIVSIALNPLLFKALKFLERGWAPLAAGPASDANAPTGKDAEPIPVSLRPVVVTGTGELGRSITRRCAKASIPVCVIGRDLDALEAQRNLGAVTVYGDAGGAQVLKAARLDGARVLVVTNSELVDKVRICLAARQVNPHVVIVATSSTAAERAWLHEFGVAHICDAQDELTESLIRSIRSIL